VEEEQEDLTESLGSGAALMEGDEEVPVDETNHVADEDEKPAEDEVDAPATSYQPSPAEEDAYEARQAERRRKREQRKKELAAMMDDTKPPAPAETNVVASPPPPTESSTTTSTPPPPTESSTTTSAPATNGTADLDSYEARKEARRKAREERLKAAARVGEDRPKQLTYKEKKALEARKNAKDSRKQWENREEDSGSK
jgi:hypothetical protein